MPDPKALAMAYAVSKRNKMKKMSKGGMCYADGGEVEPTAEEQAAHKKGQPLAKTAKEFFDKFKPMAQGGMVDPENMPAGMRGGYQKQKGQDMGGNPNQMLRPNYGSGSGPMAMEIDSVYMDPEEQSHDHYGDKFASEPSWSVSAADENLPDSMVKRAKMYMMASGGMVGHPMKMAHEIMRKRMAKGGYVSADMGDNDDELGYGHTNGGEMSDDFLSEDMHSLQSEDAGYLNNQMGMPDDLPETENPKARRKSVLQSIMSSLHKKHMGT